MPAPREELPFGLIELGSDGTILYYQHENEQGERAGFVGRNFFQDFAQFTNSKEFRGQVNSFMQGRAPALKFNFVFLQGATEVPARILLARTRESTASDGQESVFMQIERA